MPRIRTIKPEFWTDDLLGSLAREARMLFIATWNMADDEGLLRWSAPFLKGAVFPFDDDISIKSVEKWMCDLSEAGVVFPYTGGRSQQALAYVVNFHKHQKINRPTPSKLPPPSLQNADAKKMYFVRDGWECHLCGAPIDQDFSKEFGEDFCASLDHVTPISKGGSDHPSNIRAAHVTCNKGRGNRKIEEYKELVMKGQTASQRRWPERFIDIPDDQSPTNSVNDSLSRSNQETETETEGDRKTLNNPTQTAAREIVVGEVSLETKLRKAAGWENEPAPMLAVTGPIESLIEAGCSLEVDILPTIKATASRVSAKTTWNYFIKPIQKAYADRVAAKLAPGLSATKASSDAAKEEARKRIEDHNARVMAERSQKNGVDARS